MTDREKELERLLREAVDYFSGSPMPTPVRAASTFLASSPAQEETCDATHGPWTCKLKKGHAGQHSNADPWETACSLAVDVANTETEDGEPSITWLKWFKRGLRAALKETP